MGLSSRYKAEYLQFTKQSELVREFLQLLATAHECMPEKVRLDGQEKIFY